MPAVPLDMCASRYIRGAGSATAQGVTTESSATAGT